MNRRDARAEAKALAAEWIWAVRRTDPTWREVYSPADLARIDAELDLLEERLEREAGRPSLFHRQHPPTKD